MKIKYYEFSTFGADGDGDTYFWNGPLTSLYDRVMIAEYFLVHPISEHENRLKKN